jgi:hypothetical protein
MAGILPNWEYGLAMHPDQKPRRASPRAMAKVLSEVVDELSNRRVCRIQLGFFGFSDEQIDQHLTEAQHLARKMRRAEIEDRTRKLLDR